jgi:hypothetical protein
MTATLAGILTDFALLAKTEPEHPSNLPPKRRREYVNSRVVE